MKRQEYLDRLEQLLQEIDHKEKEDALAYVNEYFDDAEHKDVDEIIKELGTPEEFAKQIKSDATFKQRITPPEFKPKKEVVSNDSLSVPPKKSNHAWWIVPIVIISLLFLVGMFGLMMFGITRERFGDNDVIDDLDVMQERFEQDEDYIQGHMLEKTIVSDIKSLSMDLNMSSVEIVQTKQNETKIKLIDIEENEFQVIDENGKVEIKESVKRKNSNAKIVLQVPNRVIPTLKINNNMGAIDIENMEFDSIEINLNMGEVDLENIKTNKITVKVDMGDIDIGILGNAKHYTYRIKNNAGETEYNGIELGSISVDESGGIKDAPRHIEIENNMGDIDVEFHRERN